ncbi:DNA methyltransferase [Chthoniobacter sp.]|uniref:Eco57I restriction-modification methylase domain-containing protein n=1 Tax=Chthoniobacter sp. TaxID=2510640 RepID=UPI0032AF385B
MLDPACGSGAFLVAAQKTLLNLYTALIGRCEALGHRPILKWMESERAKHRHGSTETPAAYWLKKKIVTENLYGVDIMEEATEIAKLRLFLSLVASAEKRDQLEPLPNIEFNLLAGNSLIGLLHVDAAAFDKGSGADKKTGAAGQERIEFQQSTGAGELGMTFESKTAPTQKEKVGAHLAVVRAAKYKELLDEKNRLIALYKEAPNQLGAGLKDSDVLVSLRRTIEEKKTAAREVLDRLLLAEFQRLGIQFQQATWDEREKADGKPEKRPLKLDDIRTLQPFHWAYEFDDILINRGGFDAIITNPPWEIFKPNSKEFFLQHSELVTKKTMRVEDFEDEKSGVLEDREIRDAWLDYLSSYPHLNDWFRTSTQFANQVATANGRKVGSDVNLYKLFTEQCLNLLHTGGRCGMVIPSGIYTDLGTKQLRKMLFEQARISALFGFENRKEIFEGVHRSYKFVVLSFEKGGHTVKFPVAFMRLDVSDLATFPNDQSLQMPVEMVKRLSPDALSLVEFKDGIDIKIAEKLSKFTSLFGDPSGWMLEIFGEEFHMNRAAGLFNKRGTGYPLYEGGMIHQFCHDYAKPDFWIEELKVRADLLRKRAKRCGIGDTAPKDMLNDSDAHRLAIRKIARNTDTRTLIVALLPRQSFAGNSLSVSFPFEHSPDQYNSLRHSLSETLCIAALLNSFVADYSLRSRMTANLNTFYLYQLPIPRLTSAEAAFRPLVERAARLVGTSAEFDDLLREVFGPKGNHKTHGCTDEAGRAGLRAEIDGLVAQIYGLTEDEFVHVLGTFPLVSESVKLLARNAFADAIAGRIT